ncbi:MAG: amino acid adenylation domain-containing protein, partial [Cyanobacteria bacterium P01_G01_bin.38]
VVTAHNLAYVIYTSGSTGTPKGVQIQHQSVVNFLTAMQTAPGLSPTDQLAAVTTLAFDIAALEIYLPLIVGATVLVVPQAVTQDGHQLRAYLESTQATTLQATPATWQMLLAAGWSASSTSMTCLCGGEALSTEVARHLLSTKQALWNLYGPTETTIWSTRFCVDGTLFDEDFLPGGAIPIGYPLANTDIYVLDKHLQLVPVGIPGELHIGGIGLARGYRNRPRMTAEKFIPNPFREGRLYKTGDLVRYRSEGILEFLGRIDHQVKIRGFRIELGEIEAVLSRHQYVQQCVVAAREDTPGNVQLVAYVVGHDDLTVKALKAHLASQLPNYLIPDIVMPLAVLPLTPNGKIDRKALPTPSDQLRAELRQATEFVAPHTERQMRIATFFAEVLSLPVEHIGLHDDFFELGGHSLIATQLAARLRDAFEAELSLQVLFESPNVAALDALLSSDRTPGSTISAIIPAKRDGQPIPLAYAQERLWFLTQLTGVSATYNIATALSIQGPLDISLLQKAIDTVVHRHDILRTHFPLVEGTAIQYITPTGTVSLDVLEASDLGMSLSDWLTEIARCPFDLATGPLIRAALVRSSANAATLTITMHHIISDGWSLEIFTRELADLYRAYRRGLTSPLPPLLVQYADYTLWQRQWLTGDILDAQLSYWKQQLADAPALLELPTDHPRPAVQRFQGHTHSVSIPLSLTQALRALSQRHRVTLFITLLTGFQILLSRYSGQSDIVVGVPVANRRWGDLEPLIGFFANTLVLRTQLTSNETVTDLLQRVKRATLAAYTHQDVPFEQIVEALQPTRSLAYTPLFQVMFVLQNASLSSLALPDLTLTPLLAETTTAKFDLTLSMQETEQGLVGHWEYDTDLFEAETIARMTTHFETLLRAIAADAQQSVATLPLVTPPERQQLLADWNDTAADYPQGECIHQLFEQQVARTPKATAVVFETESLTYEALNRRANQLAHALQQLGVKPETLVGLCMERSLEMLVGLLGILKAGGAYVPLDPGYPPERLQFMLEDAQVPMLVTQQTIAADLPVHQARQVCLDTDWDSLIQPHKAHNPDSGVTPENLAYVIYTSGSTGQPKGVQGLHRGTVNRLRWMWDTYPFQPGEQCCQKTSLSFVDSVWEFFGGLLQGIPTRIIPNDIVKDPPRLIQTLSLNRISRIVLVPSLLSAILEADSELSQQLSHLKYWITSGEVLEASLCQKFCDSLPDSLLINLYGSSEVSADVTYHEIWQPQTSCSDTPLQFNDLANSVSTGDIAAAQKPTEEVLAEIWKQVLCLEKVGLHDSFFEIGGNRVSAAQVINKVRDVLDVSLPADSLQRASDIQGLAAMLKYYETEAGRTDTISRLLKQLQTPSGVNR